jgi:uncharacterized protein
LTTLLDVNVLVALTWPNHVHHGAAHVWYAQHRADDWATCPPTQAGLLRVSSNAKITPGAKSPREAFALFQAMTRLPDHVFVPDDVDLGRSPHFPQDRLLGYRQVTDAHLLAIALSHAAALAIFDQGIKYLVSQDQSHAVVEIPV